MKKAVILFGFPGVGKTTTGLALAKRLNWAFLDMDDELPENLKAYNRKGELVPREKIDEFIPVFIQKIYEIQKDQNVVVSAVFAKKDYISKLLVKIPSASLINLTTSLETMIERAKQRDHFFGSDLVKQIYNLFNFDHAYPKIQTDQPLEDVLKDLMNVIDK